MRDVRKSGDLISKSSERGVIIYARRARPPPPSLFFCPGAVTTLCSLSHFLQAVLRVIQAPGMSHAVAANKARPVLGGCDVASCVDVGSGLSLSTALATPAARGL